jgi:predicted transcriptional regulator
MTFRIGDELREALRQLAEREERPMAWLVERAVKEFVERHPLGGSSAPAEPGPTRKAPKK